VYGRIKRLVVANALLFVGLSMVAAPLADLRGSAEAMACCAKTDYTCAGMSGPDDCCQRMGHVVPAAAAGLTDSFRLAQPPVAVISPVATDVTLTRLDSADVLPAFKRPHDPPHLHAHILLI
jgi:hypothetical protein